MAICKMVCRVCVLQTVVGMQFLRIQETSVDKDWKAATNMFHVYACGWEYGSMGTIWEQDVLFMANHLYAFQ